MASFTIYSANVIVGNESISTHAFKSLASNTLTIGPRDNVNGKVSFLANVGVHTLEPASALHVAGSAIIDNSILTSNIIASNSVTAALFNGSGAGLTTLNAANVSSGILLTTRGGTGVGTSTGSGNNVLANSATMNDPTFTGTMVASALTSPGTITSATLSATTLNVSGTATAALFNGSGAGLTTLNAANVSSGILLTTRGGTGVGTSTGTGDNVLSANPTLTGTLAAAIIRNSSLGTAAAPSRSYIDDTNTGTFSPGEDQYAFSTGGIERVRIDSSGRVGIGTTVPDTDNILHIVGNVLITNNLSANTGTFSNLSVSGALTSATGEIVLEYLAFDGGSTNKLLYVDSDGGVQMSTASITNNGDVSLLGNIQVVGNIYATQDIVAFSDQSVKGNVRIIDNALSKVGMINGYTFDRTDVSTGRRHAGLLAQELVGVLDEVVYKNPDGTLALAYPNMCALLIEAVKELRNQLYELQMTVSKFQKSEKS